MVLINDQVNLRWTVTVRYVERYCKFYGCIELFKVYIVVRQIDLVCSKKCDKEWWIV